MTDSTRQHGIPADDPMVRCLSNQLAEWTSRAMEAEHENAKLREALVKLWKHTPKIDNGQCMVCRIGYVSWIPDGKGNLKVGPCDRDDCLSHVVRAALEISTPAG